MDGSSAPESIDNNGKDETINPLLMEQQHNNAKEDLIAYAGTSPQLRDLQDGSASFNSEGKLCGAPGIDSDIADIDMSQPPISEQNIKSREDQQTIQPGAWKSVPKECRVYIRSLAYGVDWRCLKDFMSKCGNVVYANILTDYNGMSKGCGIVGYSTKEEAQRAINELNHTRLMGRSIFVREDREDGANFGGVPPARDFVRNAYPGAPIYQYPGRPRYGELGGGLNNFGYARNNRVGPRRRVYDSRPVVRGAPYYRGYDYYQRFRQNFSDKGGMDYKGAYRYNGLHGERYANYNCYGSRGCAYDDRRNIFVPNLFRNYYSNFRRQDNRRYNNGMSDAGAEPMADRGFQHQMPYNRR